MSEEKILVRGIPTVIMNFLRSLAERNERGLEAEARMALREYVENREKHLAESDRRIVIAERLNRLLALVNDSYHTPCKKISHLAVGIGEVEVTPVDNWFLGFTEAPINKLQAISAYFGSYPDWLIHGDGAPFITSYERIPENPFEALAWFTEDGKVKTVFLCRSISDSGEFCVVKEYEGMRGEVIRTPYVFSVHVGNGGLSSMRALFVAFELLYKFYTKASNDFSVYGRILPENDFSTLISGNVHPLTVMRLSSNLPWWEDIWDSEMVKKNKYWEDCSSMVDMVERAIGDDSIAAKWREKIKNIHTSNLAEIIALKDSL